jgi:hypothetical protein
VIGGRVNGGRTSRAEGWGGIAYELIEGAQGAVYTRATGIVDDAGFLAHEQALLADRRIQPGFRQLLDLRWVREDRVTDAVVEPLVRLHRRHRHKLAGSQYAVVGLSATWFRLGTRYAHLSGQVALIAFNEPTTACVWLGIDPAFPACRLQSVSVPFPAD